MFFSVRWKIVEEKGTEECVCVCAKHAVFSSFDVEKLCPKQTMSIQNNPRTVRWRGRYCFSGCCCCCFCFLTRVRDFRDSYFMMGNTAQCVMTPGTFRMLKLFVRC